MRALISLAVMVVVCGCFDPDLPEGRPCGLDSACPVGQVCDPRGVCVAKGDEEEPEGCTESPCEEVVAEVRAQPIRDVDLLFVVDNSGSMNEEQTSLAANFNRFINVLQNIEGGLPNLHLGVISTDVGAGPFPLQDCDEGGDNGALQNTPRGECAPPTDRFIRDIANGDGTRQTNYTGTLADTFACIARLGIQGCGFEQPLESMRRALNGSNAANVGFLRDSALLAVVLITDEDDCSASDTQLFDTSQNSVSDPLGPLSSFRCFEFGVVCQPDDPRTPGPRQSCTSREDSQYMTPVEEFAEFLLGLKSEPGLVTVAGIIGNPTPVTVSVDDNGNPALEPSCVSASGEAAPGVRMQAFLDQLSPHSTATTICNEDLSAALVQVGELVAGSLDQSPCIAADIDLDKLAEGIQIECSAEWVTNAGSEQGTSLEMCTSPEPEVVPCWRFVGDLDRCPDTPTGLRLEVEGAESLPSNALVRVTCEVAPGGGGASS